MINNQLTLEQAIQHATERAASLSGPCAVQHEQLATWLRELQERRKAAMDSEPVADDGIFRPGDAVGVFNVGCETCPDHLVAWTVKGQNLPAGNYWLYISQQPAPVAPEEMPCGGVADDYHDGYQDGWNACRAAMLQDETVTTANKLGNSPVIPDGYMLVPIEPTKEMIDAGWLHFIGTKNPSSKGTYKSMLAAAPHDTPVLNSVQSVVTVSDTWIPVSERLPVRGDYLVTDGCDFDVQLFNGEEFIPGFVWEDKITHWMPLPVVPPAPTQENI
ncbi:DUF551 domain-containing protein [Klebsiella aerogenes]|uniref:DUF551 domain-containing protein n=1 Tax=Klebsiella aerogenes TaxID=548 RepID=UPI001D0CF992|nr:DUF551 domain-containing protein [Klebsiella aerogenes]